MSESIDDNAQALPSSTGRILRWLRRRAVAIAGLVLVIGIMAAVIYIDTQHPEIIEDLKNYGYLGAFIVSVVFNATLILPAGNMLIQMTIGAAMLSPVLVGVVSGVGAAVGETTGYVAGRSGRGLMARSKMYGRVENYVKKWGVLTIFVVSIVPFIFDLVGIAAGALRFPYWKFFIACMLGRMVLYITMIWLACVGYEWIIPWPD